MMYNIHFQVIIHTSDLMHIYDHSHYPPQPLPLPPTHTLVFVLLPLASKTTETVGEKTA